jgi:Flp pilus assembly pilin Flp
MAYSPNTNRMNRGQSMPEYALLIVLVAVVVIAALILLGPKIGTIFTAVSEFFTGARAPASNSIQQTASDFQSRIQAFYNKNGRWPRSWGDFRFTDLGLNPADWAAPVNGIAWNPNGDKIGLGNVAGDNIQIYVKDFAGNNLHLFDTWNIWCLSSGGCYYHTVAPGNEVDISTLQVVTN